MVQKYRPPTRKEMNCGVLVRNQPPTLHQMKMGAKLAHQPFTLHESKIMKRYGTDLKTARLLEIQESVLDKDKISEFL